MVKSGTPQNKRIVILKEGTNHLTRSLVIILACSNSFYKKGFPYLSEYL